MRYAQVMSAQATVIKANSGESNAGVSQRCFPWERQPDEPLVAYAHFVTYRNTPAPERSIRKLGISMERAARLSKRHSWVRRACAYDEWLLTLSDATAKHAVLRHQARRLRFGSAFMTKATKAALKLDETKLSVTEIVQLAKTGDQLAAAGLGLQLPSATGSQNMPPVVAHTSVNFGLGTPSWVERSQSEAKQNENEIVVKPSEQVIAGEGAASRSGPTTGQISSVPVAVGPPVIKRLKERLIEAPKRRAD